MMTIPVNIITGVLGVGKTTAIRHLISQRPANERWAIVVNEFGALGIDGRYLGHGGRASKGDGGGSSKGDGGIIVREVAGGCLCCAVAAPFTVAVTQLLRRAKPDRLIIEPSGLGHPGGLHDALQDEHLGKVLRIAATIALVDMTQVARGALVESEAFRIRSSARTSSWEPRATSPPSPISADSPTGRRRSTRPSSRCTSSREGNCAWTS